MGAGFTGTIKAELEDASCDGTHGRSGGAG